MTTSRSVDRRVARVRALLGDPPQEPTGVTSLPLDAAREPGLPAGAHDRADDQVSAARSADRRVARVRALLGDPEPVGAKNLSLDAAREGRFPGREPADAVESCAESA